MRSLLLSEDGDLVIERGDLAEVEGVDEIVQRFRFILRTNKGEWFLNPNEGIDYRAFWQKLPDDEEIRLALEDAASQVPEIDRLENIKIDFDRRNRVLTVSFVSVLTTGEEVELEEVF